MILALPLRRGRLLLVGVLRGHDGPLLRERSRSGLLPAEDADAEPPGGAPHQGMHFVASEAEAVDSRTNGHGIPFSTRSAYT